MCGKHGTTLYLVNFWFVKKDICREKQVCR